MIEEKTIEYLREDEDERMRDEGMFSILKTDHGNGGAACPSHIAMAGWRGIRKSSIANQHR